VYSGVNRIESIEKSHLMNTSEIEQIEIFFHQKSSSDLKFIHKLKLSYIYTTFVDFITIFIEVRHSKQNCQSRICRLADINQKANKMFTVKQT